MNLKVFLARLNTEPCFSFHFSYNDLATNLAFTIMLLLFSVALPIHAHTLKLAISSASNEERPDQHRQYHNSLIKPKSTNNKITKNY